jgi:2-phospho-L-lactate/phosphoenolpyruvate guanylyltransferase
MARLSGVQATIRGFDAQTRSGSVLLDSGVELPFTAEAFDAGRLRLARFGQRVRITVEGEGADLTITTLTLATFPPPD